jgi:hypothetical protein
MKKLFAAGTAVLLLAGISVTPAFAENLTYEFPEYGLTCSIPDTFYIFTQDMAEDDPMLDMMGISYEDEMDYLTGDGSNIILNLNDDMVTFELNVSVYDASDVEDFTDYSQDDLNELLENYVELVYTDDGYTLEDSSVVTYNGIPYFSVSYAVTMEGLTYHVMDCETVLNQLDYIYSIYSYEDNLDESQVGYLEDLVNSAQYGTPTGTEAVEAPSDEPSISAESPAVEESQAAEESAQPEDAPEAEESQAAEETTDASSAVDTQTDSSFLLFSMIGGLVAGAVMGLIPLIVGLKKRQKVLAWSGFGACTLGGILLGLLLALPIAIVFLIIILVRGKKTPKGPKGGYSGYDQNGYSGYNQGGFDGQDPWNQSSSAGSGNSGDPW